MLGRARVVAATLLIAYYGLLLGFGELSHPRHCGRSVAAIVGNPYTPLGREHAEIPLS
jgi:hypothetical protein